MAADQTVNRYSLAGLVPATSGHTVALLKDFRAVRTGGWSYVHP
jgi:hypothetical protein